MVTRSHETNLRRVRVPGVSGCDSSDVPRRAGRARMRSGRERVDARHRSRLEEVAVRARRRRASRVSRRRPASPARARDRRRTVAPGEELRARQPAAPRPRCVWSRSGSTIPVAPPEPSGARRARRGPPARRPGGAGRDHRREFRIVADPSPACARPPSSSATSRPARAPDHFHTLRRGDLRARGRGRDAHGRRANAGASGHRASSCRRGRSTASRTPAPDTMRVLARVPAGRIAGRRVLPGRHAGYTPARAASRHSNNDVECNHKRRTQR